MQSSTFESSKFSSKLSKKLLSFSKNKQFSDICIISSDDMRFHAHKCVISAFSDYFTVMLESGIKESTTSEVKINEVKGSVFKRILGFLYTGEIDLKNDTIEDILAAAHFFKVVPLIDECLNFMCESLNDKNCLNMLIYAEHHGYSEAYNKALNIASANFEKISSTSKFLELEERQIMAIIARKDSYVTSEEAVFLNLIRWIEKDKSNREKSAFNLLSKVRYWLLSLDFIKMHRSKVPLQADCLQMVCTWIEWHCSSSSSIGQSVMKPMEFLNLKQPYGIWLVGGKGIQIYDPNLNNWSRETAPNIPLEFDKVVAVNNKLIFSNGECPLTCLDLQTQDYACSYLPRMITPRRNFALAVLNDELYAIGGCTDQSSWERVVEKYNFTSGQWQAVVPMDSIIFSPQAVVCFNHLYVIGESDSMECFNPIYNKWTTFPNNPNSGFGFAASLGELYKVGGKEYSETMTENYAHSRGVQSFFPFSIFNKWIERTPMSIPLANKHCIGWGRVIITCGGCDETNLHLNLVQEFNTYINAWRPLAPLVEYQPLSHSYGLLAFE